MGSQTQPARRWGRKPPYWHVLSASVEDYSSTASFRKGLSRLGTDKRRSPTPSVGGTGQSGRKAGEARATAKKHAPGTSQADKTWASDLGGGEDGKGSEWSAVGSGWLVPRRTDSDTRPALSLRHGCAPLSIGTAVEPQHCKQLVIPVPQRARMCGSQVISEERGCERLGAGSSSRALRQAGWRIRAAASLCSPDFQTGWGKGWSWGTGTRDD